MKCNNCSTEKTPMWRRTLDREKDTVVTLCNACGLYYKSKGAHRPTVLVSKKNSLNTSELIDKLIENHNDQNGNIVVKDLDMKALNIIHCSNCQNINTSIWRKDNKGRNICNACGLYFKKKGYHRVVKSKPQDDSGVFLEIDDNLVRFNRIKRRKRSTTYSRSASVSSITSAKIERSCSTSSFTSSSKSPILKTPTVYPQDPTLPDASVLSQSPISSPTSSPTSSTPNYTSPTLPPLLIPDYTFSESRSRQYSIGIIDQYHYEYRPPQLQNFNFTNKVSYTRSDEQRSAISLPPISSILNV